MRCAIYCRVSTGDQDPGMQLDELREYVERRGWSIAGEYVDVAVSGTRDRRPELDRLWVDARRRRFDAVLVWKLDRFGRSLRHLVNGLAELEALGIAFVSLRDSLDLSTPAGRLMAQLLGAIAEFERSLIVERVKAGVAAARRRGKRIGRPRALVNHGKVAELARRGLSGRAIAREVGVSEATVRVILRGCVKTPVAAGALEANAIAVPMAAKGRE
ncbi:MAG: recombinase family protein [Candidatus Binatia bacterium]